MLNWMAKHVQNKSFIKHSDQSNATRFVCLRKGNASLLVQAHSMKHLQEGVCSLTTKRCDLPAEMLKSGRTLELRLPLRLKFGCTEQVAAR